MINRRNFILASTVAFAAPYVLRTQAHAQTTRVRTDVQSLSPTDPFFSKYAQALQAMHQLPASDPRNWRNQALIHLNNCPHGANDFVYWHRHFILNFEQICGQLIGDPSFALPYWNWAANRGVIPDPFFDIQTLNVDFWNDPSNAQSDHWGPSPVTTVGLRGLVKGQGLQDDPDAGQSFTQDAINSIQQQSDFLIFSGQLETSPHNNAHNLSGGSNGHMGDGMSPLDPIFWLHHCNVDRIWAEWQVAGNISPSLGLSYDNEFVNGSGQLVSASSDTALDFASMGYTYDTLAAARAMATARQSPLSSQAALFLTPQVLGRDRTQKTAVPNLQTRYTIATNNLLTSLQRRRAFRAIGRPPANNLAIGSGRIMAGLLIEPLKTRAPIIFRVFVNCPYASPTVPSTDKHYAGSFSLFGKQAGMHSHPSVYLVDLTKPLQTLAQEGGVSKNVDVQIVPVFVARHATVNTSFQIDGVDIIGV